MKATHLQTQNLNSPVGLGTDRPTFSWHCTEGIRQTAYQLIAKRDDTVVWDTGKVFSSKTNGILYEGEKLNSRDVITWSLSLWDENDEKGELVSSCFEMGLLHKEDWHAKWISGNYKAKKNTRYPVDCFKREFTVGSVNKARLYASAKGIYDVFINGERLEEFILAPGMTDYRKRIQYQTYDITAYLKEGKNTLEIRLADGWYRGSSAAYGVTNVYGTETAVIAQLEVNGKAVIRTDDNFSWSNDGPVEFADLKDGEIVNAVKKPSYTGRAVLAKQEGNLVSSDNVYVTEHETFNAKLIKKEGNKYVFDFGQNIAGYLAFRLTAGGSERIQITCAEVLDENKDIDMKGIQEVKPAKGWNQISLIMNLMGKKPKDAVMTPLQKIEYTCARGLNEYKTAFAVFGFRYIEVISDLELDETMFRSIAVYSDMEETGTFECSDEMVNRFVENVRWSMKSNFLDLPTDCPTRERLGWTGDAQIFFNSGAYLMDTSAFFRKWLRDMQDAQYENGVLPAVLPYQGVEMMYKATGTSVGWADAVYLIPYYYYQKYNDITILEQNWEMIENFTEYLFANLGFRDRKEAKANPEINQYVYEKGVHLGEWLEPEEFRDQVYGTKAKHPEECTAYLVLAMNVIAEIAGLVGETDMQKKCLIVSEGAKKAYNQLFVKNGTIDTDRQAKLVRPLALGLLEGEVKKNAEERLKKAVENYDYCVGTGFLSTPYILPVLEKAGFSEIAYRMLLNRKQPGWLSEVNAGATTVWENWEGDLSLNHYSPGAVVEWLFNGVLGINVLPEGTIIMKPVFDESLGYAKGSYNSVYGMIRAEWKTTDRGIEYTAEIPANVHAVLQYRGEQIPLEAGTATTSIFKQ